MRKSVNFEYPVRGSGRPQILLIGNGLERKSGQVAWGKLVDNLTEQSCIPLTEKEKESVPFPLLYEVLSLGTPIPKVLDKSDISREEKRLKEEMARLVNQSNDLLDELPKLGADHIFTTNYSYCLEKAFSPRKSFANSWTRTENRFNLSLPDAETGRQKLEREYRMHSGYLSENADATSVALWHIHGETHVPGGIVLGHDRYGRLLKRIIEVCEELDYRKIQKEDAKRSFTSWPELFLFGDIYVIGFGFEQCEFDLWWLLKRKQRERYADGTVYFYDKAITEKPFLAADPSASEEDKKRILQENQNIRWHNRTAEKNSLRNKLLRAHGVEILDLGSTNETAYDDFYHLAFADVKEKIEASRQGSAANAGG